MIAIHPHTSGRAIAHRESQTYTHTTPTHLPPAAPRRSLGFACILLAVALPPLATAAPTFLQDPTPVTVKGDVTVQGSVEVVNDVFNVPFAKMETRNFSAGVLGGSFGLDVPDGKRLVIETIAVSMEVPEGQKAEFQLNAISEGEVLVMDLPAQQTGISPTTDRYAVIMPLKLRIDAIESDLLEISIVAVRDDDSGDARVRATICGYLVDL